MKRFMLAAAALVAPIAQAAGLVQWQDNSLSYLYGKDFEVNPPIQQTITYEHVSGWSVGDLFIFTDYTMFNGENDFLNGESTYYGEFSPRFSFGKILDKDLSFGVVKDVLVATTYEFGEGDVESYLIGAGADLALPGFDFFQLNVYQRLPDGRDGDTVQITPVWKMTFPVGESAIVFDGFIDWVVNSDGDYEKNIHINPQIKYDTGVHFGLKERSLLMGIEYSYWKNKYGIKDSSAFKTDQSVVNLMVKYHF
ncbi:hypothetical protein GCM10011369_12420 [Neiella marina]|uniref:Nucleoside-specific outer membrane channel protein Tsx n=1 Tax=Neiella marina TaxID=508461 RepID=A0A8J2U3N7_9GAMM|nr:outer membrane protein OmpK [Neiella marina]GGA72177.1 hypothetical protein GCM10011369_12420 [Neiella marina]